MRCSDNVRRRRKGVNFGEGGAAFGITGLPSVNILDGLLWGLGRSDVVGVVMGVWIRFARRGLAVALAAVVLVALVGSFWETVTVRRTNQADGSVPGWADQDTWEVRLEAGHLVVERHRCDAIEFGWLRQIVADKREMERSGAEREAISRAVEETLTRVEKSLDLRPPRNAPSETFLDRDGAECQDLLMRDGEWELRSHTPQRAQGSTPVILAPLPPWPDLSTVERYTDATTWGLYPSIVKTASSDFEPTWGWWVYSRGTGLQRDTWRFGMFAPSGVVFVLVGYCAVNWYRRRPRRGRCRACGYDLRASPERCPECGVAAQEWV